MTEAMGAADRVREVILRYATGIDRLDWPLLRTCFTEDVEAHYEGVDTWFGVDEITDAMAEAHAHMGHTLHRLSNIAVTVEGDSATARTYVDAILMSADGSSGINAVGFYDDELVLTPEGWKIARRKFTPVRYGGLGP